MAAFDSNSKPSEPIRLGALAHLYIDLLAVRSGLPLPSLKQKELFDKNPGPWTLDDEDFARQHDRDS